MPRHGITTLSPARSSRSGAPPDREFHWPHEFFLLMEAVKITAGHRVLT